MIYPLGIQTFSKLREGGFVYVDKTAYVHRLVSTPGAYFLSRPRRFGKSLLLSTIQAYFEGRRDLFKGLAIDKMEEEWGEYPVLRFDFSSAEVRNLESFKAFVINDLKKTARRYGIEGLSSESGLGPMFGDLIEEVSIKTGRPVVVLIDEYDKGLHEVLDNDKRLEENIDMLRPFFSQLKSRDEYIRFAMITGVARFRHLTLFSGVNNLRDISMSEQYAAICGITQSELLETFAQEVQKMAAHLGCQVEEMLHVLQTTYDSYRFSAATVKVYNPVSLMSALDSRRISSYWLQTGTSRVFVNYLKRSRFDLSSLEDLWATEDQLTNAYSAEDPVSLLYQTGYLTIVDYRRGKYRLGIPNGEVRAALAEELMPRYMGITSSQFNSKAVALGDMIEAGDAEGLMRQLQSMLASVPYHELDVANLERSYHLSVYLVFLMLGIDTHSEIAMAGGRIDMVASTSGYVYVFEFKLDGTPAEAMAQINSHGYAIPWRADGRQVVKIGVAFSSRTRAIEGWEIERG